MAPRMFQVSFVEHFPRLTQGRPCKVEVISPEEDPRKDRNQPDFKGLAPAFTEVNFPNLLDTIEYGKPNYTGLNRSKTHPTRINAEFIQLWGRLKIEAEHPQVRAAPSQLESLPLEIKKMIFEDVMRAERY